MLTNDQMFAVRATLDNVENLNREMSACVKNINDGAYTIADVHNLYTSDYSKCLKLAKEINKCFTWANVSAYDIPQAVYDYIDENLDD